MLCGFEATNLVANRKKTMDMLLDAPETGLGCACPVQILRLSLSWVEVVEFANYSNAHGIP